MTGTPHNRPATAAIKSALSEFRVNDAGAARADEAAQAPDVARDLRDLGERHGAGGRQRVFADFRDRFFERQDVDFDARRAQLVVQFALARQHHNRLDARAVEVGNEVEQRDLASAHARGVIEK